jgi:hypothetical protein
MNKNKYEKIPKLPLKEEKWIQIVREVSGMDFEVAANHMEVVPIYLELQMILCACDWSGRLVLLVQSKTMTATRYAHASSSMTPPWLLRGSLVPNNVCCAQRVVRLTITKMRCHTST